MVCDHLEISWPAALAFGHEQATHSLLSDDGRAPTLLAEHSAFAERASGDEASPRRSGSTEQTQLLHQDASPAPASASCPPSFPPEPESGDADDVPRDVPRHSHARRAEGTFFAAAQRGPRGALMIGPRRTHQAAEEKVGLQHPFPCACARCS